MQNLHIKSEATEEDDGYDDGSYYYEANDANEEGDEDEEDPFAEYEEYVLNMPYEKQAEANHSSQYGSGSSRPQTGQKSYSGGTSTDTKVSSNQRATNLRLKGEPLHW